METKLFQVSSCRSVTLIHGYTSESKQSLKFLKRQDIY